jgi:AraC-like DNA-binding protein
MRREYPLIRSSLLAEFPTLVRELGGSLDHILEQSDLSLEQITQPTLLIPFDKQVYLLQGAARECQCEQFAIELAKRQDIAVFGALSLLIMNCNSVLHGLQMFGRYLHYSVQAVQLEIREENDLGYLVLDTPFELAAASPQFWDHGMALSCVVMRILCGQTWSPRSTYLRRPEPADAGSYSRYFRSPIGFDSSFAGMVFDRKVLHQPISSSINAVPQQLQQYLRKNFHGDFLEQVRRVITSLLPTQSCTARTVADCLGYSLRSFQRKLQAEDTSFQAEMDGVRAVLVISYLQEPQFSLTDIAGLLGFSQLSVFSRRFKRWSGVTPSQWRTRRFG